MRRTDRGMKVLSAAQVKHNVIPDYVLEALGVPTARAFRQRKRKELDIAIQAMWDVLLASAWTPAKDIGVILSMLQVQRKALSQKNWGK